MDPTVPDLLVSLIMVAVAMTITPGPATALIAVMGARFGFRQSLPLLAGVAAGLAALMAAAAGGLAAVLQAIPGVHALMNGLGSAYLLWLAVRIGRSGPPHLDRSVAKPTSFLGALWIQLQNPKGWAMTLGAAASFAGLARGATELAALLGLVFGVLALLSLMLWCVAGLLLARLLKQAWQWRILNITLAAALAASIQTMWR